MDFRQIPEVPLSLCAITSRDLRFLGRRGRAVPTGDCGGSRRQRQAPSPPSPKPPLQHIPFHLSRRRHLTEGADVLRPEGGKTGRAESCMQPGGARVAPRVPALRGQEGTAGPPGSGQGRSSRRAPSRPAPSPASPASSQRRTQLVRARDPLPAQPSPGGAGRGKVRPVLTEDAVFLQGAVDLAAGVDLQVVLGGTVELPAAGRSPEVLIDAAAPPRIPQGPRGGRSGRDVRLGQQGEQQEPDHEHRGMVAAALSPRGSGGSGRAAPGLPLTASG